MDILFWSGGKDSYLALEFCRKENDIHELKLLTTYEEEEYLLEAVKAGAEGYLLKTSSPS